MAVTKPRNRTLIFRLTQDEYESLREASSGARSLSEFARSRLMNTLEAPPLDARLTQLHTTMVRLTELLEKH